MGRRNANPLHNPGSPTSERVRRITGVIWWPKGLLWSLHYMPMWTVNGRRNVPVATYTIKSKGRTGAAARAKLMAHKRFAVRLDR